MGIWALLWIASLFVPPTVAPTGDGFTRGMNRIGLFFGLQLAAAFVALLLLTLRPASGLLRRLALLPAGLALLLAIAITGLILWVRIADPASDPGPPPGPATDAVSPSTLRP